MPARPARQTQADPSRSAGPRAFSPTSPVAQRDAEQERRTLRAAASSCALTPWIAAAGSAAAYPGHGRLPRAGPLDNRGGWYPSPNRSRSRRPTAPGSSWPGFPPLAHSVVTGYQLHRQDDRTYTARTRGRRCQGHGNPEDPVGVR